MAICGRCQREMAKEIKPEFDPFALMAGICRRYGITKHELIGDSREQHIVAARQEAYYEIRRQSGWSYPRIGKLFNRDHSTVIWGARTHQERHGFEITE